MIYTSGFFKRALRQAIFKSIVSKKQKNAQKKETLAERETREKQKLADGIRTQAKEQAQQRLKIVKDCVEILNTTVKPDVFFNRYNLMIEHLDALVGLESTGIFANSPELPSEAFLRVEKQFDDATNAFLDRSFEAAKVHAETLKTDNGKKNAIKRYFDNMEKYIIYMNAESLEHFNKMKEANITN